MRYLSVRDAASMLSVDRKTIYKLIEEDRLPAYRLSERNIRIDEDDLVAWIRKRKI